jgi:hypothetical protein
MRLEEMGQRRCRTIRMAFETPRIAAKLTQAAPAMARHLRMRPEEFVTKGRVTRRYSDKRSSVRRRSNGGAEHEIQKTTRCANINMA